jgi:lysophospholipase L1-like esterase
MKTYFLTSTLMLLLGLTSLVAAEKVFTPPTIPDGTNLAAYPLPRDDWYPRVQSNFDKTQGKQFDLIFDGDSITDGWQGLFGQEVWAKHYAPLNAVNFGIGGDHTQHLLWRLSKGQVDGMNPKMIVLMIGTNNMGTNTNDQIAEGIKAIVEEYLRRCPKAHMLLLGIFPRNANPAAPVRKMITEVNSKIASLDDAKRVTYLDIGPKFLAHDGSLPVDVMPDGLHPNAKGYNIWAEAIQGEIEKYFPKTKN